MYSSKNAWYDVYCTKLQSILYKITICDWIMKSRPNYHTRPIPFY